MKVLLTGFTGFIGKQVYKKLVSTDVDLYVISRCQQPLIKNFYTLDILDHKATDLLIRHIKPDILIHLAWDVTHGEFWTSSKNNNYANASINLFECFVKYGGEKIIATGTCAEYLFSNKEISEEVCVVAEQLTPYGKAKRKVSQWLKDNNYNFTWLRIFGIHGIGENYQRLIPSIIMAIKNQKRFILKNPSVFVDYVNVADFSLFVQKCIYYKSLGFVNIGTGISYAVYDLYEAIKVYIKSGCFFINRTICIPDNNSYIPKCEKLKNIGFQFDLNFKMDDYLYLEEIVNK